MKYAVLFAAFMLSFSMMCAYGQSPVVNAQDQIPRIYQQEDVQRYLQLAGQRGAGNGGAGGLTLPVRAGAAWWTNTALVTQLGLTDDQKAKVEKAYENHRDTLTTDTYKLGLQEGQLALLLSADPIDRNAILSQIDQVVRARGELERANSVMTLEMREVLTAAQWAKLQTSTARGTVFFRREAGGSPGNGSEVISTPFGPIVNPRLPAGVGERGGQRQQ